MTVQEFFSTQNIVILDDYQIDCIHEMLEFFREHNELSEISKIHLQDIEKKLDTSLSMNNYKLEKINDK